MKYILKVNVNKNNVHFKSSYRKNTYKKYYGTATSTATTQYLHLIHAKSRYYDI